MTKILKSLLTTSYIAAWLVSFVPHTAHAVEVTGSRGVQNFDEVPKRVAALSWALMELLIELEGPLIAASDLEGYSTWVVRPALPTNGITDTGLRTEPNLEVLAEAKPDVILISDEQIGFVEQLEKIAPVVHFELFSADQNNALASRAAFLEIAKLVEETELATEKLAVLDTTISEAGTRVSAHFRGTPPAVLPVRLLTQTSLRLHGKNSMAMSTLTAMGLEHADPGDTSDWGFTQKRVQDLAQYAEAAVVHIDPFAEADALYSSKIWEFMPFVQNGRYAVAAPSWTFGGVFSTGYLADAFADALTELHP